MRTRLKVIKEVDPYVSPSGKRKTKVMCQCSCGNRITVLLNCVTSGHTKSCGCLNKEVITLHGMSGTKEHRTWSNMIKRCSPHSRFFKWYGAREISVCKQWRNDFLAFYNHIGPAPSPDHTVDRIKNDLGYKPGNVRWATRKEQANNRRPQCV